MSMRETLEKAKQVAPISDRNGVKVVSYEDATILAQEQLIEEKYGNKVDLGIRQVNADGTIAKSKVTVLAINEDKRLANLYRVVGKQGGGKKMQVVTDYRAVMEHDSGEVYIARIPAYELERIDGKLKMVHLTTVSDEEFVSKFTSTLSNKAMYEVLTAIADNKEDIGTDEMPI